MASGPEHYREAEQRLEWATEADGEENTRFQLASAHVHAVLALAAATALRATDEAVTPDWVAWMEAAGEQP